MVDQSSQVLWPRLHSPNPRLYKALLRDPIPYLSPFKGRCQYAHGAVRRVAPTARRARERMLSWCREYAHECVYRGVRDGRERDRGGGKVDYGGAERGNGRIAGANGKVRA